MYIYTYISVSDDCVSLFIFNIDLFHMYCMYDQQNLNIIIMQTVNIPQIMHPISPDKLLQILLKTSYKQQQCQNQQQKMQQQKRVLKQLAIEYEQQIIMKQQLRKQVQNAMEIRAKLRVQLQELRLQRQDIDMMVMHDIANMKKNPLQIRATHISNQQLYQLRDQNSRMGIRLQQLLDYSKLLQKRIELIESDCNIRQPLPAPTVITSSFLSIDSYSNLDWREKIHALKVQEQVHVQQYKIQQQINQRRCSNRNEKQNSLYSYYDSINQRTKQPDNSVSEIRNRLRNQRLFQKFRY